MRVGAARKILRFSDAYVDRLLTLFGLRCADRYVGDSLVRPRPAIPSKELIGIEPNP